MSARLNRTRLAAAALALLSVASLAHAEDDTCRLALGRGWPPATENYGTTVETLLAGGRTPALKLTVLPKAGSERGLMLIPDANGGDWTLRYAQAEERVRVWHNGQLVMRTSETPEVNDVSIPAPVATRLLDEWSALLSSAAPEGVEAPFSEEDTWLFVAGDLRVSGLEPGCDVGKELRDEVDLLIEASDEGADKRAKRWRELEQSLDRLRQLRLSSPGTVANAP